MASKEANFTGIFEKKKKKKKKKKKNPKTKKKKIKGNIKKKKKKKRIKTIPEANQKTYASIFEETCYLR